MIVGGNQIGFIHTPATTDWVQRLDLAVTRKSLCTVFGPSGSGKTELISDWARTWSERASNNPQAFPLVVEVPRSKTSIPIEYTLLLRVYRALHRAAGTEYLLRQRTWQNKYERYSQRNLEFLDIQVAELLDQMPICAVVVDNAHKLNAAALDRALNLRTYYHERDGRLVRRALMLVATKEPNAADHTLTRLLKETPEALAAHGESIELSWLKRTDFLVALAEIVDGALHAQFSPALEPDLDRIGKELHECVQRNWHIFENLANNLDRALGPRSGNRQRVITRDVLDEAKRLTSAQLWSG
jgi:energy-coupling factor transporter ATP-binding protein EcfA2